NRLFRPCKALLSSDGLRRVVPRNYDPKGERFLIASRFPTPPLACAFFIPGATVNNNFPQQEASPAIVEPLRIENPFLEDQFQEDPPKDPPEVSMADDQTMAELLRAPIEGYEDAIVIPKISANNFELKHGLINLVQNKLFFGHDKEDPHAHIRYFNKITSTMRVLNSKSKVRQTRAKAVVAKVSMSSSTPAILSDVDELKDMVRALPLDKKNQSSAPASSSTPAPVKAVNQPPAYQASAYQAPIPQTQSVSKTDFESYVKANDAVLRNMQNQGKNLQIQMANLTDMLSKFVNSNTASSSRSGTLHSNTITKPKEDLKGITTRSGVAYQGPTIPTQSKVVKQGTEPVVALVSVPMPNLKPSIPYPSRHDNERRHDQANEQIKKFYEIFKDISFEISFTDALILMPKFASTLKALIRNKEMLSEMARTPMSEHCSAIILNKFPRKLGDPSKFLIPCEFPGMDECLALADLGEADAFLGLEDDPNLLEFNPFYYDPEGDILLLEAILNSEPLPPLPNHEQYFPSFKKELKVCEAKTVKSFVDEPPEVEIKDLPPYLEYAFLEGDNKLPVIIAKELGDEDKSSLIKVLKSQKRAIAWKLSDI
nr:hypothetical protein [Tanacetum cinerariifolium]